MKTKTIYIAFALLTFSFIFNACSDDDGDTTKPVIQLDAPAEGANLMIGSDIHLDMDLSDNVMLSSYKIEIHNNFNGHTHGETRATDETVAFHFDKSWDVSGNVNTHVHHHEIVIPENATPGDYHLMVYCTDAAGNESHIARNIVLSHEGEEGGHHHD